MLIRHYIKIMSLTKDIWKLFDSQKKNENKM